jgi:hypothetical protein
MPTTCEHCLRKQYAKGGFAPGAPLHNEASAATMYLRDFVADWPDQTYVGRIAAVQSWKDLRRQRAVLLRLYPSECP